MECQLLVLSQAVINQPHVDPFLKVDLRIDIASAGVLGRLQQAKRLSATVGLQNGGIEGLPRLACLPRCITWVHRARSADGSLDGLRATRGTFFQLGNSTDLLAQVRLTHIAAEGRQMDSSGNCLLLRRN